MRDIGVGRNNWFERKSAMQVAYALYGKKWGGNLVLSAAEFCFCLGGHTWQKTTGCAYAGPCAYVLCAHVHMHVWIPSGSKLLCRENFCFSGNNTSVGFRWGLDVRVVLARPTSKANNCMMLV